MSKHDVDCEADRYDLAQCCCAERATPSLAAPPVVAHEGMWPSDLVRVVRGLEAQVSTLQAERDDAKAQLGVVQHDAVFYQEVANAQRVRAEAADAQLHAEIESHREWFARATTQVSGLQAQLHAVQQIVRDFAAYLKTLEDEDGQFAGGEHFAITNMLEKLQAALPKE